MNTRILIAFLALTILSSFSCGKKKSSSDLASVDAKLRSTGKAASLTNFAGSESARSYLRQEATSLLGTAAVANSSVTIESYTVPVGRITLAQGLKGSGYTSGSSIYECPGATDDSCRVDLAKTIDVDNLLNGPGKKSVAAGTYDGIAVEFCFEHSSDKEGMGNGYFDVKLKASVVIGSTTYYTNTTSGLSSTAPSQEITLRLKGTGCGVTTKLIQPLTLADKDSATITLYADPNGSLLGTDTQAPFSNITCVGSDPASLCANPVTVYGTNDSAIPTIERYSLTFTGNGGTTYSKGLLSVLFNSSSQPIGAMTANIFNNVSSVRALNGNFNFMSVLTNSDSTLTFQAYGSDASSLVDVISNLNRSGTSTGTISQFVDGASLSWSATKY